MRSNFRNTFIVAFLGSGLVCSAHANDIMPTGEGFNDDGLIATTKKAEPRAPRNAFAIATPQAAKVDAPTDLSVEIGTTRDEVFAQFGRPTSFDLKANRWTYGDHTILFSNDRVAGIVKAGRVHHITNEQPKAKAVAAKTAAKTLKGTSAANQRRTATSARPAMKANAQRGGGSRSEWGPMFRPYNSSKPLSRSQSHIITKGDSRYGNTQNMNKYLPYTRR